MQKWIGAALAGLGLLAGCRQVSNTVTHPFSPLVALPPAPATASPYGVMPAAGPAPHFVSGSDSATMTAAASPNSTRVPSGPASATVGMIVAFGAETDRSASPIVQAHFETVDRNPISTPADASTTRTIDYSSLEGELYYVRSRNCWRLRYAPSGQPDRYGGIVTLVGDGLTPFCKDGQIVRVEGTLLDPDAAEPQPNYWVRQLTVIKQAPAEDE